MRILLASSEVHPYSKTGGLADMAGALAKSLADGGHEVVVMTPLYRGIRQKFPDLKPVDWEFNLPMGASFIQGGLVVSEVNPRLRILFVDQPGYYDRDGLYMGTGWDFNENAARFIFFSKCVAHYARYAPWRPEVVHVHDWQVGLVPLLLKHQRERAGWGTAPRCCLTIHNLAYQGTFPAAAYALTNLPADYYHPGGVEFFSGLNLLKAGIVYSDLITTVSPRYSREIMTEAFGCALDGVLRGRHADLLGILNGVDTTEWNPRTDPHVPHPFDAGDLSGKAATKAVLQDRFGLPADTTRPLFATVSRLADQKGMELQLGALEEMLSTGMQFVLLGSGAPELEAGFRSLARRWPDQVGVRIGFDNALSHLIEAGADFFLMPSRFEPCGLNQMYSLIYGTVPVVRRTGGLDDSVIDATDDADAANGIKFTDYTVRALAKAIRKGLSLFEDASAMERYRANGMKTDFSWSRTREDYIRAYQRIS
jgi:starch synthase